jgi:hypothetical protein
VVVFTAIGIEVNAFFDSMNFLRVMKKARRGEPCMERYLSYCL